MGPLSKAARKLRAKLKLSGSEEDWFSPEPSREPSPEPDPDADSHVTATFTALPEAHVPSEGGFKYKPLKLKKKSIRLFKIIKVTPAGLVGHLHRFYFRDLPRYRALSYTWGEPTPTDLISIYKQKLRIRSNLCQFLKVFGTRHLNEYIWIDQICIDQNSILERNHQVQLMSEIYHGAVEVLIWLGPARRCARSSSSREDGCHDSRCTEDHFPFDQRTWTINLIQNEYWTRMWIVQEVLQARSLKIYYGPATLDWVEVREQVRENQDCDPPLQFRYLDRQVREGFLSSTFDLVDAIRHCSKSGCQDPRDKVYALQGLLPDNSRLQIDYNKDTATIFFEAAATLLHHGYVKSPDLYEGKDAGFLNPQTVWAPILSPKNILDAIWHLACEMGFRTMAEERGHNLGFDFDKLQPLIKSYDEATRGFGSRFACFGAIVEEVKTQFLAEIKLHAKPFRLANARVEPILHGNWPV